jgi:hypothetical protein
VIAASGGGADKTVLVGLKLVSDSGNAGVSKSLADAAIRDADRVKLAWGNALAGGGNGSAASSEAVKQAQQTANRLADVWKQNGDARGKIAEAATSRLERIESDALKRIERITADSKNRGVQQQAAADKKIERIIEDTVTRTTRIKEDAASRAATIADRQAESETLIHNRLARHWEQVEQQKTRATEQASRQRDRLGMAAESMGIRQEMLVSRGVMGFARMGSEVMRTARGFALLNEGEGASVEHIAKMFIKWTAFMDIVEGGTQIFGTLIRQVANIERYLLNARRAQILLNEAAAAGTAIEVGGAVASRFAGRAAGGVGAAGAGAAGTAAVGGGIAATLGAWAFLAGGITALGTQVYQMARGRNPIGTGWWGSTFLGQSTGEIDQEKLQAAQRRSHELAQGVIGRQSITDQLRSGRYALYAGNPAQEREAATRDLAQAMKDLKAAQTERANWLKGPQDTSNLAAMDEKQLKALHQAKEAQERILQLTRQTNQEYAQQLETAKKLVEQEKSRNQSTLARFGQLPRAEQMALIDAQKQIQGGNATEMTWRHLAKSGFGKSIVETHFAAEAQKMPGAMQALIGFGDIENTAQAGLQKAQDAVNKGAAEELDLRKNIWEIIKQTATLQWKMAGFGPGGPPGADEPFEPEAGVPKAHAGHIGKAPHGHGKVPKEHHPHPHVEHGHAIPHPHTAPLKGPHPHQHLNPATPHQHEHHLQGQHAAMNAAVDRLVAAFIERLDRGAAQANNAAVIG